jgi:hypothetical protein
LPTWGEIFVEVQHSAQENNGAPDLDGIRRRYLTALHTLTGRDTIIYYGDWLRGGSAAASINLEDVQAMMEVLSGLNGPDLDLIVHSPGGSAEATASIVRYLRKKFTSIRVFVPLAAMSAATMLTLACDRIVMAKHSQLGPIDPQLVTDQGAIPARAIIRQFERAKEECAKDPTALRAWSPMLPQYGPALLEQCESAQQLARSLVAEWLEAYMFKDRRNRKTLAGQVAAFFADHDLHRSHALGIDRDQAIKYRLVVDELEANQQLQDAVLSVHHATMLTLNNPTVAKIVENHLGKAFVVRQQPVAQLVGMGPLQGPLPFPFPQQPQGPAELLPEAGAPEP